MQKNTKKAAFFYKERKRMQRTMCSFIKNAKEYQELAFFFIKTLKNARTLCSFENNACPTIPVTVGHFFLKIKTLLRMRLACRRNCWFFVIELLKIYLIYSNVFVSKIEKSAKSIHPTAQSCTANIRVGHSVPFRSVRYVLFHS